MLSKWESNIFEGYVAEVLHHAHSNDVLVLAKRISLCLVCERIAVLCFLNDVSNMSNFVTKFIMQSEGLNLAGS